MPLTEFTLIDRFFRPLGLARDDVVLGIGDDAAVLRVDSGRELVVAVDTLVEGVHFPAGTAAADIGYKSLAVNLSDFAAMGAEPAWATLALTMPQASASWLEEFAQGWAELARPYRVALVGGDTTRGSLAVTVQLMGFVEHGVAIRRAGAVPGDKIYVSGTLGDGCGGLRCILEEIAGGIDARFLRARLNRPTARVELGAALRGIAGAMIDVSDGLVADLGHMLRQSGCGGRLRLSALPLSPALNRIAPKFSQAPRSPAFDALSIAQRCALAGGDDYELCFTVAADKASAVDAVAVRLNCPLTCVGSVIEGAGVSLQLDEGTEVQLGVEGFQHF